MTVWLSTFPCSWSTVATSLHVQMHVLASRAAIRATSRLSGSIAGPGCPCESASFSTGKALVGMP